MGEGEEPWGQVLQAVMHVVSEDAAEIYFGHEIEGAKRDVSYLLTGRRNMPHRLDEKTLAAAMESSLKLQLLRAY